MLYHIYYLYWIRKKISLNGTVSGDSPDRELVELQWLSFYGHSKKDIGDFNEF